MCSTRCEEGSTKAGMAKVDRRIKRTQRLLSEALISLVLEKGYESVSIRDITERADIGYATFFRHFKSKEELLQDALQTLVEDFVDLLPNQMTLQSTREKGEILFRYAANNLDLCRVLLGSHGSSLMQHQILRVGTQITLGTLEDQLREDVPTEIVAHQLVASTLAMVQWWLDNEQPYSPERMGHWYEDLVMGLLERVVRKELGGGGT